jgi:hypothetical protein
MVSIAHYHKSPSPLCIASGRCEAPLIVPGKVLLVVADEAIIVVGNCIRRITVNDIASGRLVHYWLEIRALNIHTTKQLSDAH